MGGERHLAGKGAIVTGAGGLIGRAICMGLAEAGAQVLATDLNAASVAETAGLIEAAHGGRHGSLGIDVCAEDAPERIVGALAEMGAGCDVLVNCAGIPGVSTDLTETTDEDWDRVHAINVRAPFRLMRLVAPAMRERRFGRIVNVTSSSAHRARNARVAYGSSKSALMQLSRIAAAELGPHGITVNAVAPGLTRTEMVTSRFTDEQLAPMLREGPLSNLLHRLGEPEDIAAAVLFLCLPSGRQVTAQTIHVSGGAITQG